MVQWVLETRCCCFSPYTAHGPRYPNDMRSWSGLAWPSKLSLFNVQADMPLFKAVDAREREREVQRLQREAAEWQHKAGEPVLFGPF